MIKEDEILYVRAPMINQDWLMMEKDICPACYGHGTLESGNNSGDCFRCFGFGTYVV